MSWLSELFNPGGAYKNAANTSGQYYNQAQGQLQPYNNNGVQAGTDLQSMYQKLMNPGKLHDEWSKGYNTSEYGKQGVEEAKTAGLDAAGSMGLMGSSAALNNIQTGANNIMEKDRGDYMKQMMDMYKTGAGIGENMYGTGATAAGQMGTNAMNQGDTQAGLQFGGKNAGPDMLKGIGGGALQMLMQYLTGGMGAGGMGRGSLTPESGYSGGSY